MHPLVAEDQQQSTIQMSPTTTNTSPFILTPTMTLCASLQNVIILQVGGGGSCESPDIVQDDEDNNDVAGLVLTVNDGCSIPNQDDRRLQCLGVVVDDDPSAGSSTPKDLPDTLHLSDLEFSNAYNLFKVRSRAITGRLVDHRLSKSDENEITAAAAAAAAAAASKLSCICLRPGDRGPLLLDGSLVNLKELQLTGLTIGDETFDMIGSRFPRLTRLTVSNCRTRDQQHPVALESHYGLEELIVQDVNLADENFRRILPSLSKLRVLKLTYCNVGNETLAAIAKALVHLTCLVVTPSNSEEITDEGLETLLECRPRMTELNLESVQLTDTSVQKIVRCMPNLSNLKLSAANVGDDTLTLVAALEQLKVLELRATRVTDEGVADLVRRLGGQLEELHLESGSISEAGIQNAIAHLKPSLLRSLVIDISESTKRVSIYDGGSNGSEGDQSRLVNLQLTVKEGDLVQAIVQKFKDADSLSITSQSLSAQLLRDMAPFQTKLTSLVLSGCGIDDAAALIVLECFPRLRKLSLYETVVTGSALCEVVQGMPITSELEDLNFENKEFLKSEMIVKMVARLKRLPSYQLYDNREQPLHGQLIATTCEGVTELRLTGPSIDDRVLVELLAQYDKVERLRLLNTAVTDEGIVESASKLAAVKELALVSEGIGDETLLKCMSGRGAGDDSTAVLLLPRLTELTLKSTKVTDDGLAALDDRLVAALELFDVSESNITDVGIRRLVTRMKSIKTLNVFDNPSVNEGIREFLHGMFPEMGFVSPPAKKSDEEIASEGLSLALEE